jgi:hypothetical protein
VRLANMLSAYLIRALPGNDAFDWHFDGFL